MCLLFSFKCQRWSLVFPSRRILIFLVKAMYASISSLYLYNIIKYFHLFELSDWKIFSRGNFIRTLYLSQYKILSKREFSIWFFSIDVWNSIEANRIVIVLKAYNLLPYFAYFLKTQSLNLKIKKLNKAEKLLKCAALFYLLSYFL